MYLSDFATEQWMNDHENDAIYNMTDTCISPLKLKDLLALDKQNLLSEITLDYGSITGDIRFKEEILKLYQTGTIENITLAQGCLQANEMVMETLLNNDDIVISFTPGYQQFVDYPKSIGCIVKEVALNEENDWLPDEIALQEAFSKPVKMVILNQPSNPTGSYFNKDRLKTLIDLCKENNTWILSDEVYAGINEDEVSVSDIYEYGISTSSLSKVFSLAGLRLGWVKANQELIHLINVRRDYSIISTGPLADTLGLIALQSKDTLLQRAKSIVKENKAVLIEFLEAHHEFSCVIPQGGTVCFLKYKGNISSKEFALKLLKEHGVFYVPGSCFDCENHLRLGLTRDIKMFKQGLEITAQVLHNAS